MTSQLYLFLFFIIFFLVVFVVRSYLLWKNTGINPITFDQSDDAHSYNGKLFKFISFFQFAIVAVLAIKPDWYVYYLPFWYLEHPTLQIIGWVLLHGSLIWIFIAQLQMNNSWRIGIDQQNETKLITKGLFSLSRNPIFLGLLLADLGLFLVIPNAFTLLILVWVFHAMQIQIRLEEAFLSQTHGETYEQYTKQVRRWI